MTKGCPVDKLLTASPGGVVSLFAARQVLWVKNKRLHRYLG